MSFQFDHDQSGRVEAALDEVRELLFFPDNPVHVNRFLEIVRSVVCYRLNIMNDKNRLLHWEYLVQELDIHRLFVSAFPDLSSCSDAHIALKADVVTYFEGLSERSWEDILANGIPPETYMRHNFCYQHITHKFGVF